MILEYKRTIMGVLISLTTSQWELIRRAIPVVRYRVSDNFVEPPH